MSPFAATQPNAHLRLDPPFRAEHVGSLLRPKALLDKRALFQEKKCSAEELRAAEDEPIVAALKSTEILEISVRKPN